MYALKRVWKSAITERLEALLNGRENVIDTPQNLICLSPQLHRWWGAARIGLEPIMEVEQKDGKKGVRVRLRWLRRSTLSVSQHLSMETRPEAILEEGYFRHSNVNTLRPIADGEVIDLFERVVIEKGKERTIPAPSKDILSLQWDVIRMASLCGAAEAVDAEQSDSDSEGPAEASLMEVELYEEETAREDRADAPGAPTTFVSDSRRPF